MTHSSSFREYRTGPIPVPQPCSFFRRAVGYVSESRVLPRVERRDDNASRHPGERSDQNHFDCIESPGARLL